MSSRSFPEYHPFRSAEARDRFHAHYAKLEAESAVPSEVVMVHTEAAETLVRVMGPAEAPPFVILPGTWAHSLTFPRALIEPLAKAYRVYIVEDPWDVGLSVSKREAGTTQDTMRWMDEVFDSLGLGNSLDLFGCSKGAWRAAEYTLHAPQRLAKVIWLSPALVVQGPSIKNVAAVRFMPPVMLAPSRRNVDRMMRWLQPAFARDDEAGFAAYITDVAVGLECLAKVPLDRRPRVFSAAELGGIRVPVLYIAGADETMSSVPRAVARLTKVAPRIETAVFGGAGHDLIVAQPAALADRMLDFLGPETGAA